MWNLRRLLTLGFALLALLPLAAGGVAIWFLLMPSLRSQAIEANTILADSLVGEVRHFMNQPRELLLAGASVLKDTDVSNRQIDNTLRLVTRANNVFFATYLTDARRRISHVALHPAAGMGERDLIGLDLSSQRPFSGTHEQGTVRWSDVFFSAISSEPTIVAAIDIDERTLAGEVSLVRLSDFVRWAAVREGMQVIITDAHGQVLAHPDPDSARRFSNVSHISLLQQALANGEASGGFELNGEQYIGTALRIKPQNWFVLVAQPLESALRPGWRTLKVIALIGIAVFALALLIGFFMARWLATRTEALAEAAIFAAEHHNDTNWPDIGITEYALLVSSLRSLILTVRKREQELLDVNIGLEDKVQARTADLRRANDQLAETLSDLTRTRSDLDRAERLAALGRLVAGVAHELNTPIGNSLVVASTLRDHAEEFMAIPPQNLRRSALEFFQSQCLEACTLLTRNLDRAAELIQSFKQISADQSTAKRRAFDLAETLAELCSMLEPRFRVHGAKLEVDIPAGIVMDSFPGPLGQVVSNLIENALIHGYDGMSGGVVQLFCERGKGGHLRLIVADFGHGMASDVTPKIFEPFFTTRFGQGGTGLGLHICYQIVTGLLGGSIEVESTLGKGTRFVVDLPVKAP